MIRSRTSLSLALVATITVVGCSGEDPPPSGDAPPVLSQPIELNPSNIQIAYLRDVNTLQDEPNRHYRRAVTLYAGKASTNDPLEAREILAAPQGDGDDTYLFEVSRFDHWGDDLRVDSVTFDQGKLKITMRVVSPDVLSERDRNRRRAIILIAEDELDLEGQRVERVTLSVVDDKRTRLHFSSLIDRAAFY